MTRPAHRLETAPPAPPSPRLLDVSDLPTIGFGSRSIMWWGVVGFILIEGSTVGTAIGSYLYLSGIEPQWPPPRTPMPGLLVPLLKVLVLLAAAYPAILCDKAARRFDFLAMRRWVVVMAMMSLLAAGLQALELRSAHVRWDAHAYGSAAWAVLIAYFLVLFTDALDSVVFAAVLHKGPVKETHFPDASDNVLYFFFTIVMGILVSALVTLVPRL
jgi:cytochrome c oxidase subunit 1/cytochrome c oxidase subunit I+III